MMSSSDSTSWPPSLISLLQPLATAVSIIRWDSEHFTVLFHGVTCRDWPDLVAASTTSVP